jgi:hypothetical protein
LFFPSKCSPNLAQNFVIRSCIQLLKENNNQLKHMALGSNI